MPKIRFDFHFYSKMGHIPSNPFNLTDIFLDILFALSTLGFDPYVEPLKLYLTKYRESIKGDKTLSEDMGEDGSIQIQQQMAVQLDGTAQHVLIQGEGIQQMADGRFILKSDRFE